jgi:hypothetical protein
MNRRVNTERLGAWPAIGYEFARFAGVAEW